MLLDRKNKVCKPSGGNELKSLEKNRDMVLKEDMKVY